MTRPDENRGHRVAPRAESAERRAQRRAARAALAAMQMATRCHARPAVPRSPWLLHLMVLVSDSGKHTYRATTPLVAPLRLEPRYLSAASRRRVSHDADSRSLLVTSLYVTINEFMASFDVIFIGGGPAGYVGAIRCAQLGLSTAVIETRGPRRHLRALGVHPRQSPPRVGRPSPTASDTPPTSASPSARSRLDYGVAMKRSRAVSLQNSKGVEFLFKKNKITWIKGTGTLAGKNARRGQDGRRQGREARCEESRHRLDWFPRARPAAGRPGAEQDDRSSRPTKR